MVFWLERTRNSHILLVYRHPTSIQTPYKYTVSRIEVQKPKREELSPPRRRTETHPKVAT